MPITLSDIRALNTDYTDPETGIRYTTDTLGNIIEIAPTEVIEPEARPGQPLAVRPEEARGYRYEGALREPRGQWIIDRAGNRVLLEETDIRPYLFDPTLIEREADIARVTTPYGIPTLEEEIPEPRPKAAPPDIPGVEPEMPTVPERPRVSGEEQRKVREASARIRERAGIAPPGAEPTGAPPTVDYLDPEARNRFEDFIFQKMGGDPRGLNAHQEVMNMVDDETAQQVYIQRWQPGMPSWNDLSQNEQAQIAKRIRSDILPEVQAEIAGKVQAYKIAMDRFDMTQKAYQDRYKRIQREEKTKRALVRQEREKVSQARRTMAQNLKRMTDNLRTIEELREAQPPGWEGQVRNLEKANTQLEADIKAAKEYLGMAPEGEDMGVATPAGVEAVATEEGAEVRAPAKAKPANVPKEATRWVRYDEPVTAADGTIIEPGTYYSMPDGMTYRAKE